jgi:ribonuclease D
MPVLDLTEILIDQQPRLADACSAIAAEELHYLDTEFIRTTQFSPRLCLTQIAAGDRIFCVDELADLDTGPLWDLLCSGRGLRIVHAAKQDMEVAWVRHKRLPDPLFDTQIAAALVGQPAQVGYAGLVKTLLDVDVDKTHTRADWSLRPLAPELIHYAASDVVHLPLVYSMLREQLEKLGRYAWAVEDSARLVDPVLYIVDPGEAWRRLAGIPRLPVPAQLRARRLARWREENALRADRPRQWILGDKSLLDIALRRPRTEAELAGCAEVAPGTARRQGEALLAELDEADREFAGGTDLKQEARPELVDPEQLKRIGKVVDDVAKSLGLAPEILATRKDITAAIRGEPDLRPLTGWRRTVIGEPLLAAVSAL